MLNCDPQKTNISTDTRRGCLKKTALTGLTLPPLISQLVNAAPATANVPAKAEFSLDGRFKKISTNMDKVLAL